ncbi:MAG: phosphoglucosamine mutase, partial [Alphaproteobacteria bacterium]|nr:phosphoglucosamine mutase [Alphaproteobacteria bacterium]
MTEKLFGTDGVRGVANVFPMTGDFAMKLAQAAAVVMCNNQKKVAIAKDTRISGDMLEAALTAGFNAAGVNVIRLGVLPTPAITMLTPELGVDMSVMITASHNPYHDNGIKLIGSDGNKLSDEQTAKIEELIAQNNFILDKDKIGCVFDSVDALDKYVAKVKANFQKNSLQGMKIVLDCANGAFASFAPALLVDLGAE